MLLWAGFQLWVWGTGLDVCPSVRLMRTVALPWVFAAVLHGTSIFRRETLNPESIPQRHVHDNKLNKP